MAVASPPWAIQASSHPASAVRQANQGQMGSPFAAFAGGVQPTTGGGGHGICGATDLVVAQRAAGANMSVDVAGGNVAVRGTENQAQGVYGPCYNDGVLNVVISAADPTNARKDLIIARIRDAQYSGANNDFAVVVVTGTPSGAPVDPAVPNNSVVLARVTVPAAAGSIVNANIADLRPRAYALGGNAVVTSALLPTGAALFAGLEAIETDTTRMKRYDGANWIRINHHSSAGRTGVALRRVAVQSIVTATLTDITWDTEDADLDNFIVVSAVTATVPAGLGGLYSLGVSFVIPGNNGSAWFCRIVTSASGTWDSSNLINNVNATILSVTTPTLPLAAGDTFKAQIFQSTGGNQNVTGRLYAYREAA